MTDSWKRTKLNGKVSDLPDRISSVFNVPLSNIYVDGYICNECSYRDLKHLEKILEDAKSLQQQSLKEKFTKNNRTNVVFLPTLEFRLVSPGRRNRLAMQWIKGRLSVSATIFARRKSAGGNMIGLNQQRKSHASSRYFGGWVLAHFPEQRLVIEPIYCNAVFHFKSKVKWFIKIEALKKKTESFSVAFVGQWGRPWWVDTWACDMVWWYWSVDILFWQLSIDHNIDVQYAIPVCSWASKLAIKCVIKHWFPCGADGQSFSQCTVTWLPNFLGWIDFLTHGAPLKMGSVWALIWGSVCDLISMCNQMVTSEIRE